MSILEAIILGIVQGLTEFIPVSSSGHLVLVHDLFGTSSASDLAFDVALHLGTLLSLFVYFRRDIAELFMGLLGKNDSKNLAWMVALATIPAVVIGVLLGGLIEEHTRSVLFVAANFAVVATYMLVAENRMKKPKKTNQLQRINKSQALTIGLAQAVALLPGISRSGATITTGLYLGFSRTAATRFSFLMAIPIIAGAVGKTFIDEGVSGISGDIYVLGVGIVAAFISGLFAIAFLLRYLSKNSLNVFAYYLLGMSVVALLMGLF